MKKIALTIALAVFGLTASYAQKTEKAHLTPEQKAQKSTAKMQTELALDAKQKDAVYKIELEKFKHNESWHKAKHDAKATDKDKQKAFITANNGQLEKVLTPDQRKKFADLQKLKKDHKKEKGHNKQKAEKSKA